MATLVESSSKLGRAFVPTSALAKLVEFDDRLMHVHLTDGRIISVPLIWFPLLREASPEQRARYEIGAGGRGLHWPELDEDLSVAGLMAGVDWQAA
ncbi:MAG: DUF2442 domain-containing protein [Armatimonadetes bacterium]|nr:DUF2442 domain-containing protein [Armatimonadota bacterium]